MNNDEGINILFEKLDLVLKDETVDEAYITYSDFISFKNDQNVNILEDCRYDPADKDLLEGENIVLITENLPKSGIFVAETSKSAVIDIACTKTVSVEQWFNTFSLKTMTDVIY